MIKDIIPPIKLNYIKIKEIVPVYTGPSLPCFSHDVTDGKNIVNNMGIFSNKCRIYYYVVVKEEKLIEFKSRSYRRKWIMSIIHDMSQYLQNNLDMMAFDFEFMFNYNWELRSLCRKGCEQIYIVQDIDKIYNEWELKKMTYTLLEFPVTIKKKSGIWAFDFKESRDIREVIRNAKKRKLSCN